MRVAFSLTGIRLQPHNRGVSFVIMKTEKDIEQERRIILLKKKQLKTDIEDLKMTDEVREYLRKVAKLIMIEDELEDNDQELLLL